MDTEKSTEYWSAILYETEKLFYENCFFSLSLYKLITHYDTGPE
jgi:hypothetical protein